MRKADKAGLYRLAMGDDAADRQRRLARLLRKCCGTRVGEPHASACRYCARRRSR